MAGNANSRGKNVLVPYKPTTHATRAFAAAATADLPHLFHELGGGGGSGMTNSSAGRLSMMWPCSPFRLTRTGYGPGLAKDCRYVFSDGFGLDFSPKEK